MATTQEYAASILRNFPPGTRIRKSYGTKNKGEIGTVLGHHTNTGSGLPALAIAYDSGTADSLVLPESLDVIHAPIADLYDLSDRSEYGDDIYARAFRRDPVTGVIRPMRRHYPRVTGIITVRRYWR